MDQNTGKIIIFAGLLVIVVGVLVYFLHDKFHWIGRLPGDIRVEREGFRFYFPITTMILFSLLLMLLLRVLKKFL